MILVTTAICLYIQYLQSLSATQTVAVAARAFDPSAGTMLHQEVGVDYWKMLKSMGMYAALALVGWVMLRLFTMIFTMPRRLRAQHAHIQNSLEEFQKRYPDLKFTEEELKEAQRELEEETLEEPADEVVPPEDNKKTK